MVAVRTLADVVVVVVRHRPYLCLGLLLHHGGEVGAEGIQDLGVGEAELAVAHPLAANLGEPLGVAVEVDGRWDEFLEGVYIHAVGPTERSGGLFVVDILAVRAHTDAAVQSVPVGIGGAVVGGVVPHLAVGKTGVVHLVHHWQTGQDGGGHVGYLVVGHAEALQLQQACRPIEDRLALLAIDGGHPPIAQQAETVVPHLLFALQHPLSPAGMPHKDGRRHMPILRIGHGIERVALLRLWHHHKTFQIICQQPCRPQLNTISLLRHHDVPLGIIARATSIGPTLPPP